MLAASCPPNTWQQRFKPRQETFLRGCSALPMPEQLLCREGARLFVDRTLSSDGAVSCASCHPIAGSGTALTNIPVLSDGLTRPQSRGLALKSPRTPSLLDVGRSSGPFFWNGRARHLEDQAYWPLYSRWEMDSSPERLQAHGGSRFVARALAAFVGSLQSGPAPFDEWLRGNCSAMNQQEQEGAFLVLEEKPCTVCHQGSELRGSTVVRLRYFGVPKDLLQDDEAGYASDAELSILWPSKQARVLHSVPQSLRNLSLRNQVFGRFGQGADLRAFLQDHGRQPQDPMLRYQLNQRQLQSILAFLEQALLSRSALAMNPFAQKTFTSILE